MMPSLFCAVLIALFSLIVALLVIVLFSPHAGTVPEASRQGRQGRQGEEDLEGVDYDG